MHPGSMLSHTELIAYSNNSLFAFFNALRSWWKRTFRLQHVSNSRTELFVLLPLGYKHEILQTTLKKSVVWVGCGWQ